MESNRVYGLSDRFFNYLCKARFYPFHRWWNRLWRSLGIVHSGPYLHMSSNESLEDIFGAWYNPCRLSPRSVASSIAARHVVRLLVRPCHFDIAPLLVVHLQWSQSSLPCRLPHVCTTFLTLNMYLFPIKTILWM